MRLIGLTTVSFAVLGVLAVSGNAQAHAHHHRHFHATHAHHHAGHHALSYAAPEASLARASGSSAIRIAMHYVGQGNPTGKRGPWCGYFNNMIERKAGHPGIKSGLARDWAKYGHRSSPVPGAIAVFRGHVGRVIERVGNQVRIISGNYSHRVGIGLYSIRSAIAFRMY